MGISTTSGSSSGSTNSCKYSGVSITISLL